MTLPSVPRRGFGLDRVLGWIGVALHVLIGVFPFAPSGVVLANSPLVFVWVVWFSGLVAVVVLLRRRSRLAPLVPVGALAIWLATVAAFGSA